MTDLGFQECYRINFPVVLLLLISYFQILQIVCLEIVKPHFFVGVVCWLCLIYCANPDFLPVIRAVCFASLDFFVVTAAIRFVGYYIAVLIVVPDFVYCSNIGLLVLAAKLLEERQMTDFLVLELLADNNFVVALAIRPLLWKKKALAFAVFV